MGKLSYMYQNSDETDTSSSAEYSKKKKFSILKYTKGKIKKKKCKLHVKSDPGEDSDAARSQDRDLKVRHRLPGILKNANRKIESSDEEDIPDYRPVYPAHAQNRYLVGRVPLPSGARPGRGGGVAIIVKKTLDLNNGGMQASPSVHRRVKRLKRKCSY